MDLDEALPLSRWMDGDTTIHWRVGGTTTRRMCRQTAERMRLLGDGRGGEDDLKWHAEAFIQYDPSDVILLEWKGRPEYGWPLTPHERETQSANGHSGGVVAALVRHWKVRGGREPAYSARAMIVLNDILTEGVDSDTFADLLLVVEGRDGARHVQEAYDEAGHSAAKREETAGTTGTTDEPRTEPAGERGQSSRVDEQDGPDQHSHVD